MKKLLAICLILVPLTATAADNWPGWRGPNGDGVASAGDYPIKWSADENVKWKVPLPGKGGATPAVWGDSIFVTYSAEGKNHVLCLDRKGKSKWNTSFGIEKPGKNKVASGSNSSPTTDGKHVFVYFKSGDFACLDFDGKIVWQTNLQKTYGEDTLWWDLGTSPVLTNDAVVVAVMQTKNSFVVALDKKTGKETWKTARNLGAPVEAEHAYSTPVVIERDGKQQIVVLGADHVTTYDAASGKEIWRVGGLNPGAEMYWRSIAGPVVAGDIVLAPYARGATVTAIRLGGSGDVTKTHVAWVQKGFKADVPTPAVANGLAYVGGMGGELACVDVKTGKKVWDEVLAKHRAKYYSSPYIAGGNIYFTRQDGTTFVAAQGPDYKLQSENSLGENMVASPVFADGVILMRTFDHLFCIGK